mmetsp:Transcript_21745/g.16069  ORF Transcript_21745/g.16069 Transcript_21745/m.16069 type:complete len:304 (-) Transcript_21745:664-1575(-)
MAVWRTVVTAVRMLSACRISALTTRVHQTARPHRETGHIAMGASAHRQVSARVGHATTQSASRTAPLPTPRATSPRTASAPPTTSALPASAARTTPANPHAQNYTLMAHMLMGASAIATATADPTTATIPHANLAATTRKLMAPTTTAATAPPMMNACLATAKPTNANHLVLPSNREATQMGVNVRAIQSACRVTVDTSCASHLAVTTRLTDPTLLDVSARQTTSASLVTAPTTSVVPHAPTPRAVVPTTMAVSAMGTTPSATLVTAFPTSVVQSAIIHTQRDSSRMGVSVRVTMSALQSGVC